MKLYKLIILFFMAAFVSMGAAGQNVSLNILTQNGGLVQQGGTVYLQVTVCNTDPATSTPMNKLRPQISVPSSIASIPATGHQLPLGWTIVSNTGSVIRICNGSDAIGPNDCRTILIAIQGNTVGGPLTVSGNLLFANGVSCATSGGATPGDNSADNTSTSTIEVTPAPACSITVSASAGSIACNAGTTTLTATATGASGAVEYSLNGGAFQSANTFTVGAGTYTVTAREVNNPSCTANSNSVTVTEPTAITASALAGTIACNAGTTTLTVTASGGTGALQYSLNGGTFQPGNTFAVGAGTYTVTVKDANNCTTTTNTVTVTDPTAITASASAGTIACNGGTTTLTVTASGGTGSLQYSLNGGVYQPGNTFTVGAGSYTVTVKDANNCTATTNTVTVTGPTAIAASASAGTIACPGATTTLTVTASGGTGALQYSLNGGTYQPGNTFTVGAGTYAVTVKDANNCTATTNSVTVNPGVDNTNPTITAPANVSACTNSGCTATGVMLGTPVTADNCSVASVTNNAPGAFPLGTTTVTWTVTDASGNTATATQTVTVTDGVAPSIYLNQTGLLPGVTGPSSSATPYLKPAIPGVRFTSVLTVPDAVGGYAMAGIPDGLGAFDNCNGTFTLLMNHELVSGGAVRAHGGSGAFVSKWIINKSTMQVLSGSDLIQQVYDWNTGTQASNATTSTISFSRFCSADLPAVSAYYNAASGLGTKARIYMNGEENGPNGRQMATVVTGPDAGKSYVLGKFNLTTNGSGLTGIANSENTLACPVQQDKTIVISNSDGGTGIQTNAVGVYVGMKTNTGTEVDKAGLTNGTIGFVNVTGNTVEIVNSTTRATNIVSGTPFTLSGTSSTTFSRPEDGIWNPANPSQYFFVTTDQLDQVADGIGTQVGRSRLWRLNFTNIANPAAGGTIDMLLNGTEGHNMLDNLTADKCGHLLLQEDVGNAPHNGKIWQYTLATGALTVIAKHDPARFGDRAGGVTTPATAPFNADEESSGIIDMSDILGAGMFMTSDQAHYTLPSPAIEGGQMLAMFNPASVCATGTAQDTIRTCSGTGVNLGTPATADNCSVASVTNNAPATFPAGTTIVTWTVTDGSGNSATANQVVIVTPIPAPVVGTITQPTCATPTGSVDLSGLPSGNWTINPGAITGNTPTTTISGLVPGTYNFTVTDANGCTSGPASSVVINPAPGTPAAPTVNVTQPTCAVATGNIAVTSSTSGLTFSLDGGAYAAYPVGGYNVAAGNHTLSAQNASGCTSTVTNATVNPQPSTPAAPTVNVTQPTCAVATGNIAVTSSTSGLTVSVDGGAYAAYPVGGYNVASGNHTLTAQNASGCISSVTTATVDPQPATPAGPTVNVTQPTCSVATGNIAVTSSTTGLTFSLDGGAYAVYPVGGYTVASGNHTLTAQNASGCISAVTNATVNSQPATPAAPTVNVTQPTCAVATGNIAVTSSTSGLTFSLDGGAYAAYPVGGYNVASGNHTLSAKNASGCISAVTNATVDAQPATPAAPTVNVTQPTCATPQGNIAVTSSTTGLTFSLDGGAYATYPVGGYNVAPGNHTLTAQNAGGCISSVTNAAVNPAPGTPTAPTVNVTQPTCAVATGNIVVTSSTTGLTFSLDGGAYAAYPVGGYTVATGNHTLTAQNASGCISAVTNATVNSQPATPAAPTVNVTQPTCAVATGNITVTSSTTGLTFSLDGGAFAAYPVGGYNVAPGNHNLRAQNAGCTSTATNVTVNAAPGTPSAPTVGAITQPTCTVPTGSVALSGLPTGSWTLTRNPGAVTTTGNTTSTTVSGLAPSTYTFTVTNAAGCASAASSNVVINNAPAAPAAPTVNVTQPTCAVATGNIAVTSSTAGLTFSLDGAAYAAYSVGGYNVAAGNHTLTAKNAGGCISPVTNATVNSQPATPAAPTVSVTQPTCAAPQGNIAVTSSTTGLTFSLDGGAFAAYPVGGYNVAPGSHNLRAQNASGCTSAATTVTVNTVLGAPAAPTVGAITQPTCTVATGSVALSGLPTGSWTLTRNPGAVTTTGNTTSTTVSGIAPGTYTFTVTNAAGCTSAASSNVTINSAPAAPIAPTVSVTQPTCAVATGNIAVTSSTAGLTFSLDGGAYAAYPVGGYSVASGNHTLTAKNASGCISPVTNATVNAQPTTPAAPTVSVTQPTCTVATGNIAVTSSTAGLTFSLDGGAFAAYPSGGYTVTPGSHNLRAQNASGCTSATTTVNINSPSSSGYVIYVTNEAKFGENSDVNGDVGVTANNGKADFKKNSMLDPFAVRAKNITVQMPATVNNKVFSPATGGPTPTFLAYTGSGLAGSYTQTANGIVPAGNYKSLTIKKNVVATVNGNNYGTIVIEEGAEVTFTSSDINMEELQVKKGMTANTTNVMFSTTGNVRVKSKATVEQNTRVNIGGPKVMFHLGMGDFQVNGDNTQITLDMNLPGQKLDINGQNTIMTGQFVGDKVDASAAKNITWNGTGCGPVEEPPVTLKDGGTEPMSVTVMPNPSSDYFTLKVRSGDTHTPVSVQIVNAVGQVLSVDQMRPNSSERVGDPRWASGVYVAEVVQGSQHKTVKLVKSN